LISTSDIVSIKELTQILKNIGQCDAKHIVTSLMQTITSGLKVLTYIITARPIRLAQILMIMSVSTFKPVVILFVHAKRYLYKAFKSFFSKENENPGAGLPKSYVVMLFVFNELR
jgi:predicted GTPase